jgi:hypothetical protein
MPEHKRGHTGEARRWLDQAEKWIERESRNMPGGRGQVGPERWHWRDRLLLQMLRREAEGVVRPDR